MPDISVSSSLAATDATVELATTDTAVASLDVKGSWAGTLNVEATNTGDWADAYAPNVYTVGNAAAAATLTSNGRRRIDTAAAAKIRVRFNPYTSGAAVVNLRVGTGSLSSGGGGGGGAATIADGADVAEGATTDAAVTTNAVGTLSGKLRGLVAILSDVWNSSLHFLSVGGVAAVGTPPAANPVSVAGFDGTNKQHLLTDTGGRMQVAAISGALPAGANVVGGVTQSGTWTVQPGNTANTTAWKVDGSAVTQPVSGFSALPSATLTRPANVTAYTAQDEVATTGTAAQSFTVSRVTGQSSYIDGATLVYSSNPAVTPSFRLLLFNASITAAGDNAALLLSDTDAAKYLGHIDFTGTQAGGAATTDNLMMSGAPSRPIKVTTDAVLGLLITTNAFTPIANSETIKIMLGVEQN